MKKDAGGYSHADLGFRAEGLGYSTEEFRVKGFIFLLLFILLWFVVIMVLANPQSWGGWGTTAGWHGFAMCR